MALLDSEPGAAIVAAIIFTSTISAVNLAEVYSVLSARGEDGVAALGEIRFAVEQVVPFTEQQAEIAGALRLQTKRLGLSLGDRACLALAMMLNADVYTADKAWATLQLPCTIHLIR
jgi:ribonuclease VapC